jgi:heat shock protein HtpX
MWFSRYREFRADEGGARLAGKDKMIAALRRLQSNQEAEMPGELMAFGIASEPPKWSKLMMSHPPLSERIAALEAS